MATSIALRSLTRRGLSTPSSALCCNSYVQTEAKSKKTTVASPKKLVFNFKTSYDNKNVKRYTIPKIIESPNGDMSFVFTKTLKETMYEIIFRNIVFAERARGLKVTRVAVLIPPYINEYQKRIIMEAATDAGVFVERFVTDIAENPFPNGTDVDKGGFAITIGLEEVFDVPVREFILSGDKTVLETILSELKRARGYDLKKDPSMLQKTKEAVDRAMARMSSSDLKKTGVKLNLPVAAGQPEESTTITWTTDAHE
ncbi:hypothetical protein MKW94_000434 [Papaver nudicaule]|uniref:Uncharacterized protein n=1 Tax=Papaver nudicaule TaxID=74823 RepID=A0AA41VZ67_PAPNU|nr:hypothetical protein [Papaver nudicaule]